jgi:hypothetical protein
LLIFIQVEINTQMGKHHLPRKRNGGTGMKRAIFMVFLILLSTPFSTMAVEMAEVGGLNPDVPSFVGYAPNRIVVKFDPPTLGIDISAMTRAERASGFRSSGTRLGVPSSPQFPGARKKTYKGR